MCERYRTLSKFRIAKAAKDAVTPAKKKKK